MDFNLIIAFNSMCLLKANNIQLNISIKWL